MTDCLSGMSSGFHTEKKIRISPIQGFYQLQDSVMLYLLEKTLLEPRSLPQGCAVALSCLFERQLHSAHGEVGRWIRKENSAEGVLRVS